MFLQCLLVSISLSVLLTASYKFPFSLIRLRDVTHIIVFFLRDGMFHQTNVILSLFLHICKSNSLFSWESTVLKGNSHLFFANCIKFHFGCLANVCSWSFAELNPFFNTEHSVTVSICGFKSLVSFLVTLISISFINRFPEIMSFECSFLFIVNKVFGLNVHDVPLIPIWFGNIGNVSKLFLGLFVLHEANV